MSTGKQLSIFDRPHKPTPKKDSWLYIYQCLNIYNSDQYSALDPGYDRAYVIAKDLTIVINDQDF